MGRIHNSPIQVNLKDDILLKSKIFCTIKLIFAMTSNNMIFEVRGEFAAKLTQMALF